MTVIGVFRDLRGIVSSSCNGRTYRWIFDSLYPRHFPTMVRLLEVRLVLHSFLSFFFGFRVTLVFCRCDPLLRARRLDLHLNPVLPSTSFFGPHDFLAFRPNSSGQWLPVNGSSRVLMSWRFPTPMKQIHAPKFISSQPGGLGRAKTFGRGTRRQQAKSRFDPRKPLNKLLTELASR